MKVRDIIKNLDKSDKNRAWIDCSKLASELGLSYNWINLEDHGFSAYWFSKWLCTDTMVGGSVIFYQNEPVALTWQNGRKSDTSYGWIGGKETYKKISSVIHALFADQDETSSVMTVTLDDVLPDNIDYTFHADWLKDS